MTQERFSIWATRAHLGDEAARERRWKGAQGAAKKLTPTTCIELVRLAVGSPRPDVSFMSEFLAAFAAAHSEPEAGELTELEARLMAAGLISSQMATHSPVGDVLAVGVLCANFGGTRPLTEVSELVPEAETYLQQRTSSDRAISNKSQPVPKAIDVDPAAVEAAAAGGDPAALGAILSKLASAVQTANQRTAALATDLTQSRGTVQSLQEEVNVLWWAFNGRSTTTRREFGTGSPTESALPLASELFNLSTRLPLPASAAGLLEFAIGKPKRGADSTFPPDAFVSTSARGWRATIKTELKADLQKDLTPIIFGVERSLEVDDESWLAAWQATTGIASDVRITPLAAAAQLLRELSLSRILEGTQ